MTTSQIEWKRTPWLLRKFGYKPWRYWTVLAGVGGDFSYWTYAANPTPATREDK